MITKEEEPKKGKKKSAERQQLIGRYRTNRRKHLLTKKYNPCTKDYMEGRLKELREILIDIFDAKDEVEAIEEEKV